MDIYTNNLDIQFNEFVTVEKKMTPIKHNKTKKKPEDDEMGKKKTGRCSNRYPWLKCVIIERANTIKWSNLISCRLSRKWCVAQHLETVYVTFRRWRAYLVVSRNGGIKENRWNGQKIKKKDFPYFGVLGHQEHSCVGRILKKSLQGSTHTQFYMAIKGTFGAFLLQLCTVSVKWYKNKFPILRRCNLLVKASLDRRTRK